ncbi:hypothetical protein BpHYR1_004138 [Brachionus plicatilis]|uniref:Uncharacterized protein n=1 Tax=Brachionus plicatilis TaxID=10195 RepID=A0A3M7QHQ0_BRAPC|nr:hypothetical protein BpHYR1_004138 [Brachionus plicatilis]
MDLKQFSYIKCAENVIINGQLTDDEIIDLVTKKANNEIQTVKVEVPETEIEEDHKKIISRLEFLNMIKQQRDFLLADDNQNRDLLKKLQEIETSIMKKVEVKQQKISNYFVKL